jgi:hypothetical protein
MSKFFNLLGKFFFVLVVFQLINFAYNMYQINSLKTPISSSYSNSTTQTYKSLNEVKKSDFILSDVKAKWIGGRFRVLGDVTNIGTIPAGVQVQAKALDSYGETVDVKKYWPHSTDNLDPNDSIDIGFTITKDKSAVDVEVKIISTKIWK